MEKEITLQKIKELGLLAVIRGPSAELTLQTVDALIKGGVLGIEITLSTPDAFSVANKLNTQYGDDIVLGMGTLTDPEHVTEAKKAGAKFLVSPIFDETLSKAMVDSGLVTMIGALTPSEVFKAYRMGSDVIKIFPGRLGGPDYIKDLKGPFPYIPMMPTGGVDLTNMIEWFAAGVIAVGAGSNLCPKKLIIEGKFSEITEIAGHFVEAVKKARQL